MFKTVKELKRGEFFKRKESSGKVYMRGEFCRDIKKFECDDFNDISRSIYLRGDTVVFVGFEF